MIWCGHPFYLCDIKMEGQGERRSEGHSRSRSADYRRRSNPPFLLSNSSVTQSDEHVFDNLTEEIGREKEDIETNSDDDEIAEILTTYFPHLTTKEDIETKINIEDEIAEILASHSPHLTTEDRQSVKELLRRREELAEGIYDLIEVFVETRRQLRVLTERGRRYATTYHNREPRPNILVEDALPLDHENQLAIEEVEQIQATHVSHPATEEPPDQQSTKELFRCQSELETSLQALIEAWQETELELLILWERIRRFGDATTDRNRDPCTTLPTIRISKHHINNNNSISSSYPIFHFNFEFGEQASQIQCGHVYHPTCIFTWLDIDYRSSKPVPFEAPT
jgi:hypothetical protein